jgi:hypothetical protein
MQRKCTRESALSNAAVRQEEPGSIPVPSTILLTLQRNHLMQSNVFNLDDNPSEVKVRRLFFKDWGNHAEAAIKEVDRLLATGAPGCWYVNAISCVYSSDPVDEFFDKVARRQGAWCRMLAQHFGKGWRTIRKQTKARYQRGVEFEGVLIIEGKLALPEDIPEIRRLLGQLPNVIRRDRAFRLLKQREIDELRNLTNEEFKLRRKSVRSAEGFAYFILPHATVESPADTNAFRTEARRRDDEWHRSVARLCPEWNRREFRRNISDLSNLIPKGVFLIGGKLNCRNSTPS